MMKISDVSVVRNGNTILSDISLNVADNEILAIFGPDGAGKSTLLKAVCGLVRQSKGSISLGDVTIDNLKPNERAELGVIYVQAGSRIFPSMTVLENIELGAFRKDARSNMEKNRVGVFATFPKLAERRHQKAGSLSGGEKQMLAIARGLMSEPKLLMLDEPLLGLAPIIKRQIFSAIGNMKSRFSVIIIEHDVLGALEISDGAIFMQEGRIILERFSTELLKDRQTMRKLIES